MIVQPGYGMPEPTPEQVYYDRLRRKDFCDKLEAIARECDRLSSDMATVQLEEKYRKRMATSKDWTQIAEAFSLCLFIRMVREKYRLRLPQ